MIGAALLSWGLHLATIGVGVVAGLPISPYFDPMLFNLHKVVGRTWPGDHPMLWYGSTLALAALALAIAALPAVLVWRLAPRSAAPILSRAVWFVGTTAVAWPAVRVLVDLDD